MLLEQLVALLLAKQLAPYIEGLKRNNFKFALSRGEVSLDNIQLRPLLSSLNQNAQQQLPIRLAYGTLGRLRVRVPLTTLKMSSKSTPSLARVDNVLLILEPNPDYVPPSVPNVSSSGALNKEAMEAEKKKEEIFKQIHSWTGLSAIGSIKCMQQNTSLIKCTQWPTVMKNKNKIWHTNLLLTLFTTSKCLLTTCELFTETLPLTHKCETSNVNLLPSKRSTHFLLVLLYIRCPLRQTLIVQNSVLLMKPLQINHSFSLLLSI